MGWVGMGSTYGVANNEWIACYVMVRWQEKKPREAGLLLLERAIVLVVNGSTE